MSSEDPTVTHAPANSPASIGRAGKYRIIGRIGEGGMGVVYRAIDDDLGRTVALKFIPPHLANHPAAEQRFLREARAASALDHINIGTIFGVEETEDQRRFIVMAYYDGRDLRERIKDTASPLTRDEVLSIAIQIARGLEEAHSRGVVHRDIKPSNILINAQGVVKIVDFGLASMSNADQLTVSGAFMGTPAYMSPEQAQGQDADHRSDIWSLGVVVLEMLTRRPPFQADSVAALLYKVVHGELPALGNVDEPLRSVLERALRRDPSQRYQSAGAFATALQQVRDGRASAPSRVRTLASRVGRAVRARGVLVGTALLCLFIVLAAGLVWRSRITTEEALPSARARASTGAFEKYLQALELMKRWDKEGNLERATALLTASTREDPNFALGFARLAEAQRIRYALTRDTAALDAATKNANEALRLNPDLAPVHIAIARIYAMRGNNDLALASCERALRIDSNDAEAHQAIARLYERLGRLADAESSYRRALALDPDSISIHDSYGNFLFRQSRHADAIREWQSVVRLAPDNAAAWVNLGSSLSESGEIAEAITTFQRAVEIKPSPMAYANLGTAFSRAQRLEDASVAYRKALELDDKDSMIWGNLAYVYSWMSGMDDRARRTFQHAIELAEAKRRQSPRDAFVHTDLALYYAKTGKPDLAIERLNTALALAPKGPDVQAAAAEVYELLGQRDKGVEFAKRAMQVGYSRQRLQRNPELSALMQSVP